MLEQGIHKLTNFTISDKFVPSIFSGAKASVECRAIGKVAGQKGSTYLFTWKAIIEVIRGPMT